MPNDTDSINALNDEWVEAINEGNLDRWIEGFTDDSMFMAPDVPILIGKRAIYDWAKVSFFEVFDMTLDNVIVELDVADDWACGRLTSSFTATPKGGGDTLNLPNKVLAVFRKQPGGDWKWYNYIFNWDAPLG